MKSYHISHNISSISPFIADCRQQAAASPEHQCANGYCRSLPFPATNSLDGRERTAARRLIAASDDARLPASLCAHMINNQAMPAVSSSGATVLASSHGDEQCVILTQYTDTIKRASRHASLYKRKRLSAIWHCSPRHSVKANDTAWRHIAIAEKQPCATANTRHAGHGDC